MNKDRYSFSMQHVQGKHINWKTSSCLDLSKDLFLGSLSIALISISGFPPASFVIAALQSSIISESVITHTLFFLQASSAIKGLLWFRINVKISSNAEKNTVGILVEVALHVYITLGSKDILTISILLIHEHSIHPFTYLHYHTLLAQVQNNTNLTRPLGNFSN